MNSAFCEFIKQGFTMFAFIVRRIIQAIMVMLVIGMVGFVIQHQIGDPVRDLVGERVTPAEREVIRDKLGLNDPFYSQYYRFVKNACQGDLGMSFFYKKPALEVIISKAPATIELVMITALILIVISIPAGIFSAIYPKSWISRVIMAASTIGVAMPVFLTAIALIYLFGVELNWLPSYGRGETVSIWGWESGFLILSVLSGLR
jgi:peptide/nickel transport system permease protein